MMNSSPLSTRSIAKNALCFVYTDLPWNRLLQLVSKQAIEDPVTVNIRAVTSHFVLLQ